MSILVIVRQNTKVIVLLLSKIGSFSSLFNMFKICEICNQNQSIENSVTFGQNTKAIALLFHHKSLIFITFQSAIKINQFQFWSFFAKMPSYSLILWPKIAHFHHFSICNKNQSISILVTFEQNTKAIVLLFGKIGSFSSLVNLQSKSMNFNFGDVLPKKQGYSLMS